MDIKEINKSKNKIMLEIKNSNYDEYYGYITLREEKEETIIAIISAINNNRAIYLHEKEYAIFYIKEVKQINKKNKDTYEIYCTFDTFNYDSDEGYGNSEGENIDGITPNNNDIEAILYSINK